MSRPALIRTDFASAEDAADAYGVPRSRVEFLRRALESGKRQATQARNGTGKKKASRGMKRRARKK